MRRIQQSFTLVLLSLFVSISANAQSWVKKATKSVFALQTFSSDGSLLGSATGVFVGEQGEAISSFAPFKGASRAVVIDAAGKEWPVEVMLGANETYDVARFRVGINKSQPVVLAQQAAAEGSSVWLLPQRQAKQAIAGTMRRTETFNTHYNYYTVKLGDQRSTFNVQRSMSGLPLFDAEGQLLALMQQPATDADTLVYAVSALFADSLKMTGLSINDASLRTVGIKKALPTDFSQAQLTLYVAGSTLDSVAYAQLIDDFIAQFPQHPDGYVSRALFAANAGRCSDADSDMAQALRISDRTDETHFNYSRMIYQKLIYRPEPPYEPWTFDRAFQEAEAAYEASPQALYRQQQAYIRYAQQQYAEAASIYATILHSELRSPDLFFEAARCHLMQNDTTAYIAMLDSAVAMFSRPYLKEAAPYILARAQAKLDAGKYRDATTDLNDYEQLMAAQVNDQFYYLRFQAEQGGRLFQQALNDITKAVGMNPDQELYYAEKASLEVRVGLYDEAIKTANECIARAPEYSDGHLFLGLARCLKGQKADGVKSLQRARELGDPQADALIEKYGKGK